MTDQDYHHLELLLIKLRKHLDRKYLLCPEYHHDGFYISVYTYDGQIEYSTIAADLKTAAEQIKNRKT